MSEGGGSSAGAQYNGIMRVDPATIHTAAQMRALDRYAIEQLNISGYALMRRAGAAACAFVREQWPQVERIIIVCGSGNNAGDGYVLARCAREQHLDVDVIALTDPSVLKGDAQKAWSDYQAAGGAVHEWSEALLQRADLVVDAIFGTGLSREVDALTAARIETINSSRRPIFALDVPSGLHADTGAVMGVAVRADCTLTFGGLKLGFYLGQGPNHIGRVAVENLDLPESALTAVGSVAARITRADIAKALPQRPRVTHKGEQGRVLLIGGGSGMAGAMRLAGEAALRVGAGLVTVATHPENVSTLIAGRPELICHGVSSADLKSLLEHADVIAVGPGLGQSAWAKEIFSAVVNASQPLVLDADALNLLATTPRRSENWVLTPHPGEAARLLQITTAAIQADRLSALRSLQHRYGGTVILKGAGTLVLSRDAHPNICSDGNPGMASAGMGDVLTGVIAGLAAQVRDLTVAARVGVKVHAMAGDRAASKGERGLIASDLFSELRACVNPISAP